MCLMWSDGWKECWCCAEAGYCPGMVLFGSLSWTSLCMLIFHNKLPAEGFYLICSMMCTGTRHKTLSKTWQVLLKQLRIRNKGLLFFLSRSGALMLRRERVCSYVCPSNTSVDSSEQETVVVFAANYTPGTPLLCVCVRFCNLCV